MAAFTVRSEFALVGVILLVARKATLTHPPKPVIRMTFRTLNIRVLSNQLEGQLIMPFLRECGLTPTRYRVAVFA